MACYLNHSLTMIHHFMHFVFETHSQMAEFILYHAHVSYHSPMI